MNFREFEIWQSLVSAQGAWTRLLMKKYALGDWEAFTYTAGGALAQCRRTELRERSPEAADDFEQLHMHMSLAYQYVCVYYGDPLKRGAHRYGPGLHCADPAQDLSDLGLQYIDTVLVGPGKLAASMLLSDSRLMASARSRVYIAPENDPWLAACSQTLAIADAISASAAVDAILRGRDT